MQQLAEGLAHLEDLGALPLDDQLFELGLHFQVALEAGQTAILSTRLALESVLLCRQGSCVLFVALPCRTLESQDLGPELVSLLSGVLE